jgi:tRNA threonylcarbamoyladenosine biosynthesis protein TsaE
MKKVRGPAAKKNKRGMYQSGTLLSIGLDSTAATMSLGQQLVRQHLPHVWLLRGDLGAGKTTLARGVLRGLGVRQRVTSPTFTLTKVYMLKRQLWHRVLHVDAYRIKNKNEVAALDLASAVRDQKTLVLVEWPERLGRFWLGPVTVIKLKHRQRGRWVTVRTSS